MSAEAGVALGCSELRRGMGARTFDAGRLGAVVERCYDAVIMPDLWPAIFQDFADAANATGVIGFVFGEDSQKDMFLCSRSLEEATDVYIKDGWYARNPRILRAARVCSPDRLISDADLGKVRDCLDDDDRAWRNDFLRKQGLGWFAGTDFLYCDNVSRIGISIERSLKVEAFQSDELAIMHRAMAQMRRALSLAPALDDAAAKGLLTGLEAMGRPAALLDRAGRVILLNAKAERLFGETLLLREGHLRAGAPDADRRLQRFVASLVRPGARCDDDPTDFVISRDAGGRPLIIRGAPIAALGAEIFKTAKAFVTFEVVGRDLAPQENVLREAFGLTPAEARVARSIGEGRDISDIAARQGVGAATVRTQLKSIFAKTDTRRQAALTALVARFRGLSRLDE